MFEHAIASHGLVPLRSLGGRRRSRSRASRAAERARTQKSPVRRTSGALFHTCDHSTRSASGPREFERGKLTQRSARHCGTRPAPSATECENATQRETQRERGSGFVRS
jgi:hypothetical protein